MSVASNGELEWDEQTHRDNVCMSQVEKWLEYINRFNSILLKCFKLFCICAMIFILCSSAQKKKKIRQNWAIDESFYD